ncbi:putative Heat shock protein [Daphnia magna]|uniref:Putative Heat shock protein n=1 Tax=Daphnia magna TaxID=35525 RepID=A0A162T9M7_9CRUS|nr:putative Heat shock protein [Daphnia magna]
MYLSSVVCEYWSSPEIKLRFKTDVKGLMKGCLPENIEVHPGKCHQAIKFTMNEWLLVNPKKAYNNTEPILHDGIIHLCGFHEVFPTV